MALTIKALFDSGVEDILGFKTCCGARAFDQNLELLVTNTGAEALRVPGRCVLGLAGGGQREVPNLMPYGGAELPPGHTAAFYCTMDPALWAQVRAITFFDHHGRAHTRAVSREG